MYSRLLNIPMSHSFLLFGARGTGKTTELQRIFQGVKALMIDLLEQDTLATLQAHPQQLEGRVLQSKSDWVIIDEIQKVPELLDIAHRLIESRGAKFALTGSSARKLKRGGANLLAGRAFVFNLFPLTCHEIGEQFDLSSALSYGTLPKVISLAGEREKRLFLTSYAHTYLREEVVVEQLVRNLPPFRRFLEVAAAHDTEIVNYSNVARDILTDATSVSNYYSILEETLLGFFLQPFHASTRKRYSKAPKFYWFDTGVRRALAGQLDYPAIPKSFEYGSLFESFLVNEIHRLLTYSEKSFKLSYLRTKDKVEVDLIIERPRTPTVLIEIKSSARAMPEHVHAVRSIMKDIKGSRGMLLSLDETPQKIDDVECLPWRQGLKELELI